MEAQFEVLPLDTLVQALAYEILEAHTYVLTSELAIWSNIIIQKDTSREIALDLSRTITDYRMGLA